MPAQDLIERVRANPKGDYSIAKNNTVAVEGAYCHGRSANCDTAAMARYDLLQWKCSVGSKAMVQMCAERGISGQLPEGDGSVEVNGNVYTITIKWFDTISNEDRSLVITSVI